MIRWYELRDYGWRAVVANLWDWLFRRSCWAETACWMMRVPDYRLRRAADPAVSGGYCPDAVDSEVGCWCGKFCAKRGGQ